MADTITINYLTTPTCAAQEWRFTAKHAEELRVELKAAQAAAYLTAPAGEGQKLTDSWREAYATAQTADLAKRAATAAVEARVAERWAEFVLTKAEATRGND